VKIKDIINEAGFWSGFRQNILPEPISTTMRTLRQTKRPLGAKERTELEPQEVELAKAAHAKFGDNPESVYPGFVGWLPPQQLKSLVDYKAKLAKQREKEIEQARVRQAKDKKLSQPAPPATIASKIKPAVTTAPPPQVQLPSGEYITKYGGSWYNEQGQQITQPGDIASLERRTQAPAGQSQMATTKNIPVALPGFKGKRR
jgi:hypothetical protein